MVALFYRKDRFEKLDGGHFWLSETPGQGRQQGLGHRAAADGHLGEAEGPKREQAADPIPQHPLRSSGKEGAANDPPS